MKQQFFRAKLNKGCQFLMPLAIKEGSVWFTVSQVRTPFFSKPTVFEIRRTKTQCQILRENWIGDESSGMTKEEFEEKSATRKETEIKNDGKGVVNIDQITDCEFAVLLSSLRRNQNEITVRIPKNLPVLFEETATSLFFTASAIE